jgi:hypothetical protein
VASNTDYMRGVSIVFSDNAANAVIGWATADTGTVATESDTITLDGSTKSGYIGTQILIEDIATAVFHGAYHRQGDRHGSDAVQRRGVIRDDVRHDFTLTTDAQRQRDRHIVRPGERRRAIRSATCRTGRRRWRHRADLTLTAVEGSGLVRS